MGHDTNTGLARDDRAQTLQDYTIGIGIFVLSLAFVFMMVGGYLSPFTSGLSVEKKTQADQMANTFLTNHTAGSPNQLNLTAVNTTLAQDTETLQRWYGLPFTSNLNVTITSLNGTSFVTNATGAQSLVAGDNTAGRSTTKSVRIITIPGAADHCDQACRLVVKVW